MRFLDVAGARLYFETHRSGPLVVMVPGATGTADSFKGLRDHLAAHYAVVTYDRRGFSQSQLDGPQDNDHRLETDADDVRRLIAHVSDEPAILFGSSSGAIGLVLGQDALGRRLVRWRTSCRSHGSLSSGRPLGHLLSIFGHARGESMVDTLMPILKEAGFSDVEGIPTRHKNVAFIRAH